MTTHELRDLETIRPSGGMTPPELIERLRAIATRTGRRDGTFLRTLADVLEHRAVDPAYSETARDIVVSIVGEVGQRVGG